MLHQDSLGTTIVDQTILNHRVSLPGYPDTGCLRIGDLTVPNASTPMMVDMNADTLLVDKRTIDELGIGRLRNSNRAMNGTTMHGTDGFLFPDHTRMTYGVLK